MPWGDNSTLFIFLDESGNFDFTPKGSAYWSLTAFCTYSPTLGRDAFLDLLYSLAHDGIEQEYFHATEDRQQVRDQVFNRLNSLADDFEVHSVIAEKRKAHPSLYTVREKRKTREGVKTLTSKDPTRFYELISRTLLRYILRRGKLKGAKKIVIVLSSIFTKEKHAVITGTLKSYLKQFTDVPFHIYFRSNKSDINCQLADYCGWAIAIAWERGELRSLGLIEKRVKSQFGIFTPGHLLTTKKLTDPPIPCGKSPGALVSGSERFLHQTY